MLPPSAVVSATPDGLLVEADPTTTQSLAEEQDTPSAKPLGRDVWVVQVAPSSVVASTSAPLPTAQQSVAAGQETAVRSLVGLLLLLHVVPPLVVVATEFPTAIQSRGVGQEIAFRLRTVLGIGWITQVVPPSVVATAS